MQTIIHDHLAFHVREDGNSSGRAVVFCSSLGTDFRAWDALLPHLPSGLRFCRYDKRGHGLSDASEGPYSIEMLSADAAAVMDQLGIKQAVFVGLSIGGQIAQMLAAKRPDLVSAIVLMDTAARLGDEAMWRGRIDAIREGGIDAIADATMERWFHPDFHARPELAMWRNMLTRTSLIGYLGCCEALAVSDLTAQTGALTLPTLGLVGSHDGASPPGLVRASLALIPGSEFHIIEGAGHLPCAEKPRETGALISAFLSRIGHQ